MISLLFLRLVFCCFFAVSFLLPGDLKNEETLSRGHEDHSIFSSLQMSNKKCKEREREKSQKTSKRVGNIIVFKNIRRWSRKNRTKKNNINAIQGLLTGNHNHNHILSLTLTLSLASDKVYTHFFDEAKVTNTHVITRQPGSKQVSWSSTHVESGLNSLEK